MAERKHKFRTYFVRQGEHGIKIGRAVDPIARLRTLQMYSAIPLELLGTINEDVEFRTKWRFRASRIRGEWFRQTEELLAFIRDNAKPAEAA